MESCANRMARQIQAQFSDSFGRWTAESNLHLTLRFFGSVEETEVLAIAKKVQAIATVSEQLSLTPGPFGCFPSNSRPCILWLGFKGGPTASSNSNPTSAPPPLNSANLPKTVPSIRTSPSLA